MDVNVIVKDQRSIKKKHYTTEGLGNFLGPIFLLYSSKRIMV